MRTKLVMLGTVAVLAAHPSAYALDVNLPADVSVHTLDVETSEDVVITINADARLKGQIRTDGLIRIVGTTASSKFDCILDPQLTIAGFANTNPGGLEFQFGLDKVEFRTEVNVDQIGGIGVFVLARKVEVVRDISSTGPILFQGRSDTTATNQVVVKPGAEMSTADIFQVALGNGIFSLLPGSNVTSETGLSVQADAAIKLFGDLTVSGNVALTTTQLFLQGSVAQVGGSALNLIAADRVLILGAQHAYEASLFLSVGTELRNIFGTLETQGAVIVEGEGSIECFFGRISGSNGEQC